MSAKTKKYSLTPEHRAQLPAWRGLWIKRIMSTEPMTDEDRQVCREAVLGLYAAAKLPPPKHIVFVPSPFVAKFAGGFAAWLWHLHNQRAATYDATYDATDDAMYAATDDATDEYWYRCDLANVARVASRFGDLQSLLSCAQNAYRMWNGGNQWGQYASYLSFFRHVVKLDLDYSAWSHYETLAIHSGPRVMHKDFCLISDRPAVLSVDAENRPHSDTGPFCQWRDGSALYSVHGVRVPWWVIEHPEQISPQTIAAQANEEVRRVMIERYGWVRYIKDSGAELLDARLNERDQQKEGLFELKDGTKRLVVSDPSTGRRYALGVPRGVATCQAAQDWMSHGLDSRATVRT